MLLALVPVGCASVTNPVARGLPVRLVPPELLATPRGNLKPVPLNLLRQPPCPVYRLAPGDVLGVFVEGYLGERNQPIPLQVAQPIQTPLQRRLPPAAGYPVPVEPDGTIALPLAGSLPVTGLSIAEAREAIRALYVRKKLINPQADRVIVTLMQQRQVSVMVVRQEGANFVPTPEGVVSGAKRGTGFVIDLPGGENDVLNALVRTGGLPGLDAYDEVIVERDAFQPGPGGTCPPLCDPTAERASRVTRIPLRLPPGCPLPIRPEEVVLHNGDVVLLANRVQEVFYTGGLLPAGLHRLPRDRDLDVVAAIALVRGPLFNGSYGGSNLSGTLVQPGVGYPSASLLTVIRRTPDGGQVPIIVDLREALRSGNERILVKPGDVLILQEKPGESLARYFTQTLFNFSMFYQVFHTPFGTGAIDVAAPDRLGNRTNTISVFQQSQ